MVTFGTTFGTILAFLLQHQVTRVNFTHLKTFLSEEAFKQNMLDDYF